VVGEAGIGKTSFAVHGARRLGDQFPHGTLFVALGGLSRPDTVTALRAALQDPGVEPPNQAGPPESLASLEQLGRRHTRDRAGDLG